MTEPQPPDTPPSEAPTPGVARREGLKKSKWVAAGVAVGAAAFLTGVIAGVNGADDSSADGRQISSVVPGGIQQAPTYGDGTNRGFDDGDDDRYESDDDDDRYESDDDDDYARPFDPRSGGASSGSSTQQAPSSGPQTRSGGS